MAAVKLADIIEHENLENLTPEIDIKKIKVTQPDINRPALQMAGYFEHFEATRLQIIGFVEYSYMESLTETRQEIIYERLLDNPIPGVIFCRELKPNDLFRKIAVKHGVPLLMTRKATSAFTAEIIRWLNVKLAPMISVHGVLVDVYGEGVLITGESGICEGCGVATLSISYYDIGKKAGEMAYDILVNGADPATMKIEYAEELTKKYDKARAEAMGIKVPEDYVELTAE